MQRSGDLRESFGSDHSEHLGEVDDTQAWCQVDSLVMTPGSGLHVQTLWCTPFEFLVKLWNCPDAPSSVTGFKDLNNLAVD